MMIPSYKIELTIHRHIGSGYWYVGIYRNVRTRRIINLVIRPFGNRKGAHISFTMIKYGIYIWRKYTLEMFIHRNSRIRPPQKGLRKRSAVINFCLEFNKGLVRIERETERAFCSEHFLILVHPNGFTAVRVFLNGIINGIKGRRAMVLRPVKLNSPADPGAGQTDQGRFDHIIMIDKMIIVGFVIRHLDTPTQFWQYHNPDKVIFQVYRIPGFVFLLIIHFVNHRMWVYYATAALVYAILEKHGVLVRISGLIGWNIHILLPCFYFHR